MKYYNHLTLDKLIQLLLLASALQQAVQQATGAVDSAGIAGQVARSNSSRYDMSLDAIIKRHKRTLINFQQSFLLPFVTKAAQIYAV